MPKLGLALSGGGFRATLFHLGGVRFLRDAGALRDVTDIAAVSGGSILAAHLVLNWDQYNGDEQRFAEAAAQIVKFVQFDVRNHIVRRLPLLYVLRFLAKRIPGRGRGLTANAVLERYYKQFLKTAPAYSGLRSDCAHLCRAGNDTNPTRQRGECPGTLARASG